MKQLRLTVKKVHSKCWYSNSIDEFDDLVEQAQNQDTYDEESGLELHDVLEQAGDEGVDLDAMEEGEIATFEAVSAYSARSTQQVTIEE